MYSNFYDENSPFSKMYIDVSEKEEKKEEAKPANALSSLFSKFSGDNSFITLLILAFLLFDADEDERLIILALAFLMGI